MKRNFLFASIAAAGLMIAGACTNDRSNTAQDSQTEEAATDDAGMPLEDQTDSTRYPAPGEDKQTTTSGDGGSRSVTETPGAPGSGYGAGVSPEDRPATGSPAGGSGAGTTGSGKEEQAGD